MINIVKKKINMSDELKAKINWSCKFNKKSYQIIEGYLRIVKHTNLSYIEPHKIIVKDTTFLAFNYSTDIYVSSLNKKIQLVELEDYWKFSKDLYTHKIFSDKTIESIQDDYIWNKENDKNKDKGKDDYEIKM